MDEESQIVPQSDDGDNGAPDDLEDIESEAHLVQRAIGLVMSVVGPTSSPLISRFTPEHITQFLNSRENDSLRSHERSENDARRAHSAGNSERWLTAWFGTLILAAAVGLIVFFGIRETYEVVTAIIGGLLGFAGGFGVGRMRR